MQELHGNEQYFFDEQTLDHLSEFASSWDAPCCLCAPLLGQRLAERGVRVTVLDIDKRFNATPGYQHYDIRRPEWLGREFDLIICDPPFFSVSLLQLFVAIRILARNDYEQILLISYLRRRSSAILRTFAPFHVRSSGYCPSYQTVERIRKNEIEVYANLSGTQLARLLAA